MEAANAIDWIKPPSFALNSSQAPLFEWFTDAEVNTCYNALDRHVESGRADQQQSFTTALSQEPSSIFPIRLCWSKPQNWRAP